MRSYTSQHLAETAEIVQKLDPETLEDMVDLLAEVRQQGGRLFFLGVGGSAENASDAVNDFRKIAGIECYAPTDNVYLVSALQHAKGVGASILGIVGRDGEHTAKVANACCIVPTVNPQNVTPHSEAFQAVIWHLVSHPKLKVQQTKWESTLNT
jgi:D-sedoheptulose 7-phosphate isomerase